mgnify:CR=1 FL=1
MKRNVLIILFLITALAIVTTQRVNSNLAYPKAGNSGDPFTGNTCAQSGCHPSPSQASSSSILTFNIGVGTPTTPLNSSFKYNASTTYNLAFLLNSFTGDYGFQVVALDASNNQAGSFAVTDATNTKLVTSPPTGTRQYMGHKNASAYKSWVFQWTSPAASTGAVTFYYAYNTANNDGSADGDIIYNGSVTIQPNTTGISDISNEMTDLSVIPNPVSNEFGLSFNMKQEEIVSAQIFSLDGKLSKELFSQKLNEGSYRQNFNIQELPAGVYLVKINAGEASVTKKIIKL